MLCRASHYVLFNGLVTLRATQSTVFFSKIYPGKSLVPKGTEKTNKMIFPTYLHVRDAFIRASSPRTMFHNTRITQYTAEQRLDIIKKVIETNKVSLHDDFLQILFFAIEFHDPRVANNWDIIKYLIKEKKVDPGKMITEEYEDQGDFWGRTRRVVYQNLIIDFIIRGNKYSIMDYLLRHEAANNKYGKNSLLEQFMKYYIGDGTAGSQMKILPLRKHSFGIIRLFAEHFGKQFRWYHNTKMILSFLNQLGTKHEYQNLTEDNKYILMGIIDLLQGYLERALNERKQIGSELPLPNELAELVLNYF